MELIIKPSPVADSGSFAPRLIKKGEHIRFLSGEIVALDEIFKRVHEGKENNDDPLQIGEGLYIDLDEPSRLINHSCEPNAGIRGKNELFALRDIQPAEEISYDYSTTQLFDWTMERKCRCRSQNCRKIIGNIFTIPKERLKIYWEAGAIPDYLKPKIEAIVAK